MGGAGTRVAVVERQPIFREGLAQVVRAAPDLVLAVAVGSVAELDGAAAEVVLLGEEPAVPALPAVRRLRARGCAVLVVAASELPADIARALGAGARGYLGREAEQSAVLEAIRAVAAGRTHVSAARGSGEGCALTGREREVVRLVAEGRTDRGIAEGMGISLHTVHSHLDRIRDKTGSRRRADLTRLAIEQGLGPGGAAG